MVFPVDKFEGKDRAEQYMWEFLDKNLTTELFSIHGGHVLNEEINALLMIPDRGIVILAIKDYAEDQIIETIGHEMLRIKGRPVEYSGYMQALKWRENILKLPAYKNLIDPRIITVAVCYPFITADVYRKKGLEAISPEKLTLLADDFKNAGTFLAKIKDIFDFVYAAQKMSGEAVRLSPETISQVGDIISPSFSRAVASGPVMIRSFYKLVLCDERNTLVTRDKEIHAKYSVLIAGEDCSIAEIQGLLKNGIKVIWFAKQDEIEVASGKFAGYKDAGFLELYANDNDVHTIIVDGTDVDGRLDILQELEKGDVGFNLEQYIIEHQAKDKNLIIEAGAGTGKTHVMINRIMYLMHMDPEFDFSKVAMITFTNKATDNMRLRLIRTLDAKYKLTGKIEYVDRIEQLSQISISTIHSFFRKVIVEVGSALGYGTNVQLKSYVQEKKELLRDLLDKKYQGRERVEEVIGLPVHQIVALAMEYWEKLDNNGIAEEEIRSLAWGEAGDEKARLIQSTLIDIFSKVDEEYNKIKYINNAISMKDIIHELGRVIDRPELKDYISDHYRYMFCDEFQDSDNVQIQTITILNRIYGGNLFVVGDIKQSIYRFRGATDSAFKKLRDQFNESENERLVIKSLTKNYRTSATVMKELDLVFRSWGPDGWKLLQYDDSDRLAPQIKEPGIYRQIRIRDVEREKKLIGLIKDIQRSSKHKKITCLARKNSQLREIKAWCEKEKIVCLIKEKGSFYTSRAVLDLCALLEAYLYDNEPMYLYNYVNSPYGTGYVDLGTLEACQGEKHKLFEALLKDMDTDLWKSNKADLRNRPVLSVIRKIVSEADPVKNFGIRRKAQLICEGYPEDKAVGQAILDARQYDADLKKLLQILADQFSGDFSSLTDLCDFIRLKISTDHDEDPAEIESSEGINYVEGLTVHSAKGLEFENVIVPYMNDPFYQAFRSEILISKDHKLAGWAYREKEIAIMNKQYDDLLNEEEEEVAKEETRLLYVAMTRAIYGLYCFTVRKRDQDKIPSCWTDLLPKEKDNERNF